MSNKPKTLDAAYERRALEQGHRFDPVFEENRSEWGQPLPKKNQGPAIGPLVAIDIHSRNKLGVKKYGTVLQPNNGRDALKDAYEEALDLCQYLRQALFERDGK